jgi:DNA-binding MarR family transcriptional regulator
MESVIVLATEVNLAFSNEVEILLREVSLTKHEFELLSLIRAADGRANQSDLCRTLGLSRATMSEALNNLASKGLIIKQVSPTDARAHQLFLTPATHRLLVQLTERIREVENLWVSRLSEKEIAACSKALRKLLDSRKVSEF